MGKRDRKIDKIKNFTFDDFSKYFHMTQSQAAYELDVYPSIFSEMYKKRGINRWPYVSYRMLKNRHTDWSHEKILETIKNDLENKQSESVDKNLNEIVKSTEPDIFLENISDNYFLTDNYQLLDFGYVEFPDLSELMGDIF